MGDRLFLLILTFFLLLTDGGISHAQIYKWVDEKGTVHFSDGYSSGIVKSQDGQDKDPGKNQDKKEAKNQDNKQVKSQDQAASKKAMKDDPQVILKNLEMGNRRIPEDMKKYAPAGGIERSRSDGGQIPSSPSTRRS